mgnify:CR=1 FL=1
MNDFLTMIKSIDLNNLLNIFDIQIAIAVILVFTLFRGAFATTIISIYYKIIKEAMFFERIKKLIMERRKK